MVKRGHRAVYVSDAVASEKMTTDLEDEFRRKVRMFGHCWILVFKGRMFGLRALGPTYWVEMISHRLLRYASGLLHIALLVTSLVLALAAAASTGGCSARRRWCCSRRSPRGSRTAASGCSPCRTTTCS